MSRRNRSKKIGMAQRGSIALMFGTFTVLFLYLAAVVPPKFALPLLGIAGLFVAGVMAEQEIGKAILMFCCCCVAAMILIPNFQAYAPYIAFFGWYGIAKFPLDEMKDKLTKWILKLILFNVGMALAIWWSSDYIFAGWLTYIPLYLLIPLGEILFLVYDALLWFFYNYYNANIRRYLV